MSSFLNNSGDIILDAVLTDYGRQLLARGDGSFNVVKFAFGDDEIDYSRYEEGAPSALRDQYILDTPIMEAMTNNAASMKSKLLTITNKNLLFLPVLALYQKDSTSNTTGSFFDGTFKGYAVPANAYTLTQLTSSYTSAGVFSSQTKMAVRIDQGLDSNDLSKTVTLSTTQPDLYETEYNVMVDNRFGVLVSSDYRTAAPKPTVDDDQVALYKLTTGANPDFVAEMVAAPSADTTENSLDASTPIKGTRGSKLSFAINPSLSLTNGNYFDKYGVTQSGYSVIKTVVKVVGATTGCSIDIPVAFAKKV
jgi:hypothetical protein